MMTRSPRPSIACRRPRPPERKGAPTAPFPPPSLPLGEIQKLWGKVPSECSAPADKLTPLRRASSKALRAMLVSPGGVTGRRQPGRPPRPPRGGLRRQSGVLRIENPDGRLRSRRQGREPVVRGRRRDGDRRVEQVVVVVARH